jgi:hypothetical protein
MVPAVVWMIDVQIIDALLYKRKPYVEVIFHTSVCPLVTMLDFHEIWCRIYLQDVVG